MIRARFGIPANYVPEREQAESGPNQALDKMELLEVDKSAVENFPHVGVLEGKVDFKMVSD
jgi:hypothetical protein